MVFQQAGCPGWVTCIPRAGSTYAASLDTLTTPNTLTTHNTLMTSTHTDYPLNTPATPPNTLTTYKADISLSASCESLRMMYFTVHPGSFGSQIWHLLCLDLEK